MTPTAEINDPAAAIRGERRAQQFLTMLRSILGDGDELARAVAKCPPDELPSFLRCVQKRLEGRR